MSSFKSVFFAALSLAAFNPSMLSAATLVYADIFVSDPNQSYPSQSSTYSQDWLLNVTGGSGSGYFDLLVTLQGTSNEGSLLVSTEGDASFSTPQGIPFSSSFYVPDYGLCCNPTTRNAVVTIPFTFGVSELIHLNASASAYYVPSNDPILNRGYGGNHVAAYVTLDSGPIRFRNNSYPYDTDFPYAHGTFAPTNADPNDPQYAFGKAAPAPEPATNLMLLVGTAVLGYGHLRSRRKQNART